MKKFNKQTGIAGEKLALNYLLSHNYQLIATNYCTKFGEIDLVMKDGRTLIFVEVKTKIGADFGTPEDMFTRGKYNKVKRMASLYLNGREVPCRIDVVAIVLDQSYQLVSLHHYPNVYPL